MPARPHGSGGADAATRAARLRAMDTPAPALHRLGHIPVIGVKLALPVIEAAGGDAAFEEIMMPLSLALAGRCDGCLRIGAPSAGADAELAQVRAPGLPVRHRPEDVPVVPAR